MAARKFTGRAALSLSAFAALTVAGTLGVTAASASEITPTTVCPAWTLHSIGPNATSFSSGPAAAGSMVVDSTHVDITKPFTGAAGATPDGTNVGGTEFAAYTLSGLDPTSPVDITVDYSLSPDASTAAGAIRLFYYDVQNANTISVAPKATVAATASPTGTLTLTGVTGNIGTIGMVYDASNYSLGTVMFSNLRITDATHELDLHFSNDCVSANPSPTPSASKSSGSSSGFPKGGVQTGGGKPASGPWLPLGLGLTAFALLAASAGVIGLRRQHQSR